MFTSKTQNIFKTIWKVWLASVLVNLSWFIIWALVDLSIILLVAVWSFPISLLSDSDLKPVEKISYCPDIEIWVNLSAETHTKISKFYNCKNNETKESKTAELMKNMNSMSWPLLFMWASILQLDKSLELSPWEIKSGSDWDKSLWISFLIHFILVILFVVPIVILIVVWIIRIFRIWIYVAFAPLILLDQIFWWKIGAKHASFRMKNMFWLIFQPVLVVFALWVALIFLATLQSAFVQSWSWDWKDPAKKALGVCEWSDNSLCLDWKTVVTIEWNLNNSTIKEKAWWFFGFMILSIMTVVILWSMIKLAFQSTEITKTVSDSMFKFAEDSVKAVPVVPTWHWMVWIWAIKTALGKTSLLRWLEAQAAQRADWLIHKINELMWVEMNDLSNIELSTHKATINNIANISTWIDVLKSFIEDIKKTKPNLIPSASPNFQQAVAMIINRIAERWGSTVYNSFWLTKKVDWKTQNITRASEMFNTPWFRAILTWIIRSPWVLKWASDLNNVLNKLKRESTDYLSNQISNINS